MGRKKIEIETIDDLKKRKSSFLKRRSGLLKKGYEISVLADTPAAIITFSPENHLCQFSRGGRLEDILINYLNGPDDPGIAIPNKAEIIAELERIKTENDNMAAEQEARNGGANPRINLAENDDDEDLKRLMTGAGNRDLPEVMKEIIRILNLHPQNASLSALEYCKVKLQIILHSIAIRKGRQGNPVQHQQQQYNIPPQLQQQMHQMQQLQQQQQYQYYHLQQQQQQQQQSVTVTTMPSNNVISSTYNMPQLIHPGHELQQQQPRTTIHHQNNINNNMNMEPSGTFLDQLGAMSSSVPAALPLYHQNDNGERGLIIRGGSSSGGSNSRQYENKPLQLPIQQRYLSRPMGFPNGHIGQGLNQNQVQSHTGNGHVDRSSISFQQPNTLQNLFGDIFGAAADNTNTDFDEQNKNQ